MCALTFNKPIFCANQEKRENGKDLKYYHCLGRCQLPWPSKALSKLHYLAIPPKIIFSTLKPSILK
jgi:hypothetical protein